MTTQLIVSGVLLCLAIGIFIRGIWRILKLPHRCKFYTHDMPCVRYAQCYCGAGIAIDSAIKQRIPIYAREHGGRIF
jgi:hypothetical protein